MKKYILKEKKNIILSVIFSIINVIGETIIPILIGYIIDAIINNNYSLVYTLITYCILLIIIVIIYDYLLSISSSITAINISNNIKEDAIKSLVKTDVSIIDKYKSGNITSKIINDSANISYGLRIFLTIFIPGIVTIITTLIIMVYINLNISLIVILITPLSIFTTIYIASKTKKLFDLSNIEYNNITGFVKEQIYLKKYVKTEELEDEKYKKLQSLLKKYYSDASRALFYSATSNPTTRIINGTISCIVILFSSFEIMKGNMTIGLFSTFLIYANRYAKPLNEISQVTQQITQSFTSFYSINEIINFKKEKLVNGKPLINGNINFENVNFSYNTNREILKNINFSIKEGENVAIVGSTGSGKTTIIQLLLKFYNINSGNILIDGNDIYDINTKLLRDNIKVVLQDSWLNSESIKDIIKYDSNISNEQILNLLYEINIKPNFLGIDNKLNNIINISELSNGQKQILSMLRVILSNPKIVILDEATSDVDTLTEKNIDNVISKLTKDRTSIIIAHRLSTIINADKIIVLDNGIIKEVGNHLQLLNNNDVYKSIYESQF